MIVAFTGHRPEKIGGYSKDNRIMKNVRLFIESMLLDIKPDRAISGMALGVDQLAAELCCNLGIPWEAAIPFLGQESRWPDHAKKHYMNLLSRAATVTFVSPPGYAAWKMQKRNQYMVDACDALIAIWDGSTGGTGNCVKYASSNGKKIFMFDPK